MIFSRDFSRLFLWNETGMIFVQREKTMSEGSGKCENKTAFLWIVMHRFSVWLWKKRTAEGKTGCIKN